MSFSSASTQFTLLYQKDGDTTAAQLGFSVASAGDVDGDGRADFIEGAPLAPAGGFQNVGSAFIYSGATGALLFQKNGAPGNEWLGYSVAGAGDVNGDGRADFIIGAVFANPGGLADAGSAYVYSGFDGSPLFQKDGAAPGDLLSHAVAGAGDVNGDGRADFIVGANGANPGGLGDAGSAYVYSGADGSLLFQKNGAAVDDELGYSVSSAGDVNGDGRADFIVGAPYADPGGLDLAGSAFLYSGADGSLLFQKNGAAVADYLGISVAGAGDVNGDGKADFIIGAGNADPGGLTQAGSAYVYSGADGSLLFQKNGAAAFDLLGWSVASAGDVNGDGRADFIIGAVEADPGGLDGAGSAYLYSGLDGSLLYQKNGGAIFDELGRSVASAGDVNGDGRTDVIVGAPKANPGGNNDAGSAFVYGLPAPPAPPVSLTPIHQKNGAVAGDVLGFSVAGAGDVNGDGKADFVIGAAFAAPGGLVEAGSAYLYSGATGALLYQKDGAAANDQFGYSVTGAGDVNGDGKDDFIIGANTAAPGGLVDAGSAYLYSGAIGALLYQKDGAAAGDNLGSAVAGAGDVNGDGKADFIIGAAFAAPDGLVEAGSAYLYSGAAGVLLYQKNGDTAGARFGYSVAGGGDINGDGRPDFIIGSPYAALGGTNSGSVIVYSGSNGTLIDIFAGSPGEKLGQSVASAGDVNGDGRDDYIMGAPGADNGPLVDAGRAFVISGLNGTTLRIISGDSAGDQLGISVAGAGDVNGDGKADFIIGAVADPSGLVDAGSAYLYSGATGALLYQKDGAGGGDFLGSVAGAGDLNGDGKSDIIIGAAGADPGGLTNAGSAFVYGFNRKPLLAPVGAPTGSEGQLLTFTVSASDPDGFLPMLSVDSATNPAGASLSGNIFSWTPQPYQVGVHHVKFLASDGFLADTQLVTITVLADTVVSRKDGAGFGDLLGSAVSGGGDASASVGDVNADGTADYIIGAPGSLSGAGSAFVYSGTNHALLYSKSGGASGDRLGGSVGLLGDVSGDGAADFVIGAPEADSGSLSDAGVVYVYSGATGALLYKKYGLAQGDRLGGSVGLSGNLDADGDNRADFAAGAPEAFGSAGAVYVYSGTSGNLIFQKTGAISGDRLGGSVGLTGDVNGDNRADLIAGAPDAGASAGQVFVYSGPNGNLLHQKTGAAGERLGGSVGLTLLNDVDGDGAADFAAGAPGSGTLAGAVYVYSGATGNVIFQKTGLSGDRLGGSVGLTGDVDGDSRADLLVGAPEADPDGLTNAGSAFIYSGQTGSLLSQKNGEEAGDRLGGSVGVFNDADGGAVFVVGAPNADPNDNDDAGSAFIFHFVGKGDLNGDGVLTPADVALMLNCVYLRSGYCGFELADLTCDGQISPADLVKELNAVYLLPPLNSLDCPL